MIRSSAAKMFARSYVGRYSAPRSSAIPTTHHLVSRIAKRGMADFTMAQLKELRGLSGAPIVECKTALTELKGDVKGAMDWLRKHGAAKASQKVSGREAQEGLVSCVVSEDGKSAALVKISSETDFAGKSPAFVNFVTHVADSTLESGAAGSLDAETVLTLESNSKSVQLALEEAIVAIRENLGISSAFKMTSDDGMFVSYVHGRVNGSNAGSAAAVVELAGTANAETMQEAGKKLAMHIVAAKPLYLNPDSVPSDIIEREKEVLQSQVCVLFL
jgi:elongation factor Ts